MWCSLCVLSLIFYMKLQQSFICGLGIKIFYSWLEIVLGWTPKTYNPLLTTSTTPRYQLSHTILMSWSLTSCEVVVSEGSCWFPTSDEVVASKWNCWSRESNRQYIDVVLNHRHCLYRHLQPVLDAHVLSPKIPTKK